MDHSRVAATVLDAVGGPENISAAAHCATRLRLVLVDNDKIDQKTLDNDPDIKGTFAAGGMFQIIIGPGDVNIVYKNLADKGVREVSKDEAKGVAAGEAERLLTVHQDYRRHFRADAPRAGRRRPHDVPQQHHDRSGSVWTPIAD